MRASNGGVLGMSPSVCVCSWNQILNKFAQLVPCLASVVVVVVDSFRTSWVGKRKVKKAHAIHPLEPLNPMWCWISRPTLFSVRRIILHSRHRMAGWLVKCSKSSSEGVDKITFGRRRSSSLANELPSNIIGSRGKLEYPLCC